MTPPSLVIDDLAVERGGSIVLADISVSLRGGVTAILGPNGSGKTSLLRTLATVAPPAGGRVLVEGQDVSDVEHRQRVRGWLGYAPQATRYHPRARVFDAVDYVATLRLDLPTSVRQRETWRALDLVGIARHASERMGELSEGFRQRVTLAQAMLGPPRLVILDEPLVALDPEVRLAVQEALMDLGRKATVVMASHLVNEACEIADQVVVLGDRQPVFTGTPAELTARAATGGTPAHGYLAVRSAVATH